MIQQEVTSKKTRAEKSKNKVDPSRIEQKLTRQPSGCLATKPCQVFFGVEIILLDHCSSLATRVMSRLDSSHLGC